VDVPSGLNADTGEPASPGVAVEASVTLTINAPKTGLLAQNAWPFVGRLEVADDVGLIPCPHTSGLNWDAGGRFSKFSPAPSRARHRARLGIWESLRAVLAFMARQFWPRAQPNARSPA